jgi:4-diphosphocytidyl-2-C-methyl-D-erythritol kinase
VSRGGVLRFHPGSKLNLFLRVLGPRPDGHHEIETVFHEIDFSDDLEAERAASGTLDVAMEGAGPVGPLPLDDDNLVRKAALALADATDAKLGARLRVRKRVPIGAGLGGGSADAAGTLIALSKLWGPGVKPDVVARVAADLGSDVSFFLRGGTGVGTSRGERVTTVPHHSVLWFVLVVSERPLLTRAVYGRWSGPWPRSSGDLSALLGALGAGDADAVGALLRNDLEAPAIELRPELREVLEAVRDAGALGARVTGSGPTVFGPARNEAHARSVAARLAGRTPGFPVIVARSAPRRPAEWKLE